MKTWRNLSESVYNNTGLKFELVKLKNTKRENTDKTIINYRGILLQSSPNLAATQIAFELAGKVRASSRMTVIFYLIW